MQIKDNFATYLYAVEEFKKFDNGFEGKKYMNGVLVGKSNPDLIEMNYGKGKDYIFHKDRAYELLIAIMGRECAKEMGFSKAAFYDYVKKLGIIKALNRCLKGHGFVMVTNFANYTEYSNETQNEIIGITSMDLNGNMLVDDTSKLFNDEVSFNEMYNYDRPLEL